MTTPSISKLTTIRAEYDSAVRAHIESTEKIFIDMAISIPGAAFILAQLEEIRLRRDIVDRFGQHDSGKGPFASRCGPNIMSVLDMGCGFSTSFINDWVWENTPQVLKSGLRLKSDSFCRYVGVDHNLDWLAFMRKREFELTESGAGGTVQRPGEMMSRTHFERRLKTGSKAYKEAYPGFDKFDAILVDHGPELQTRADDVPWLLTLLRDDGIMLFDDWRPKHEGRIRRALASAEPQTNFQIYAPEGVRRFRRDKTIGAVSRRPVQAHWF